MRKWARTIAALIEELPLAYQPELPDLVWFRRIFLYGLGLLNSHEMPSELAGSETVDRRWRRLAIIEHLTVVNREANLSSASLKGHPAI